MPDPTNHHAQHDTAVDETALDQTVLDEATLNEATLNEATLDEAVAEEAVAWTWVPTGAEQTRIDTVLDYAGPDNAGPSPLEALRFANEVDAEHTANALEVTAQGGATGVDLDTLDDTAATAGLSAGDPLVEQARAELLAQALDLGDAHLTTTTTTPTDGTTDATTEVDEPRAAGPADDDSGWMVFDPARGGFVDLPTGHPILTDLAAAAADPTGLPTQTGAGAGAVAIDRAWWDERATTHDRATDDTLDRDHTTGHDHTTGYDDDAAATDVDLGWSR